MPAYLANLTADRDGDAFRLDGTDVSGKHRRQLGIEHLLSRDRRLAQVHHGGGIDIDIIETGSNRFPDQGASVLRFRPSGQHYSAWKKPGSDLPG